MTRQERLSFIIAVILVLAITVAAVVIAAYSTASADTCDPRLHGAVLRLRAERGRRARTAAAPVLAHGATQHAADVGRVNAASTGAHRDA
jgi:hypothetical protein